MMATLKPEGLAAERIWRKRHGDAPAMSPLDWPDEVLEVKEIIADVFASERAAHAAELVKALEEAASEKSFRGMAVDQQMGLAHTLRTCADKLAEVYPRAHEMPLDFVVGEVVHSIKRMREVGAEIRGPVKSISGIGAYGAGLIEKWRWAELRRLVGLEISDSLPSAHEQAGENGMKTVSFTEKERSRLRGYVKRLAKHIGELPHEGALDGEIELLRTVYRKLVKDKKHP